MNKPIISERERWDVPRYQFSTCPFLWMVMIPMTLPVVWLNLAADGTYLLIMFAGSLHRIKIELIDIIINQN